MTEALYVCPECGKEALVKSSEPVPFCCGLEMKPKPLPFCTTAPNPEMARSTIEDTPCDDGTGPKSS
jgi:hypothetical protein